MRYVKLGGLVFVASLVLIFSGCVSPTVPDSIHPSAASQQANQAASKPPIESIAIPSDFFASGISSWHPRLTYQLKNGFEFIRIPPESAVQLSIDSDSSLDQLRNPVFWGYGIRHIASNRILPVYGQLEAQGWDPLTNKRSPVRYKGYFKLHQFSPSDNKETVSLALQRVSLVGFAGERTFMDETHFVVSTQVANASACEWQYNFWNSKQRFWGTQADDLLSFHARIGRSHNEKGQQWRIYPQMPRPVILDLEKPDLTIFKKLIASVAELPTAQYRQNRKYSSDYIECNYAQAYSGNNIGNAQHRYALFYPRLKQFGRLAPVETNFRFNRTPGLLAGAKLSYGSKPGSLSKFLLMSRYEPWMAKKRVSLPVASFSEFGSDMLYAVGPNNQLELWHVDPKTPDKEIKARLFKSWGHKVKHRFPLPWSDLDQLVSQGYLEKCDAQQQLLVGACDGSRFPTVLKSNRGEQMEVWDSAEERWLYSWNPSNKRLEVSQLAPLSEGAEAVTASREQFICQQLADNLSKIDRRLQRSFISDRPYTTWYENDVPRLMGYARQAVYAPRYDSPTDVADKINDRERAGARELYTLWQQARRAERLASEQYCPETKALAAEYVPLVGDLHTSIVSTLDGIWKDVQQQAWDIEAQINRSVRSKNARDAEAWQRQFWANTTRQLQSTMDITSTVNQITAQTNAMYQNTLQIQEARRLNQQQKLAELNRKRAEQQAQINSRKQAPVAKNTTPTTEKKPAYEGFPKQQSFNIQVPNAVSVKGIEKATKIGGTTTVTINPGGGSSTPGSMVADTDTTPGPKPVKKGKRLLESLSFCKPSKHNENKWFCEGRTQKMWTSEDLDEALTGSGCMDVRTWVPLNGGRLYFCNNYKIDPSGDTGKITWNRDIARWVDIPPAILADRREFFE
ncbi:hypothetical protein [uncultured Amphritea sp.]|uniref:hypothetical protein n=1 Tax=uncultured Amphritea sp. TaxID=981605 RepID=UPI0025D66037|nr:hypothetical protein [uncultured Amphritea sp.]